MVEVLVVKKRIRRPSGVEEKNLEVDVDESKSFPELRISLVETIGFGTPEFNKVSVKLTGSNVQLFHGFEVVASKVAVMLKSRSVVPVKPVGEWFHAEISQYRPKRSVFAHVPLRAIQVHLGFLVSKLNLRPIYAGKIQVAGPKLHVKTTFREIVTQSVTIPSIKRATILMKTPEQAFAAIVIRSNPDIEEQAVVQMAGLTSLLFKRDRDLDMLERDRDLDMLGLGATYLGEPIIIFIRKNEPNFRNDKFDYHYVILEICKELYRESRGGLPKPFVFVHDKMHEEHGKRAFHSFLEFGEKFNDKIVVLDLEGDLESFVGNYGYVFRELFSQGLGFIIFLLPPIKDEGGSDVAEVFRKFCEPYRPKIVDLSDVKVDKEDARLFKECTAVIWGLGKVPSIPSPSWIMSCAERTYKDMLHKLLCMRRYLVLVRRGENESEDHLALKVLVVKHLIEKEKISEKSIKSEWDIGREYGGNRIVADIYIDERGLAIEIETLYETGPAPLLKVRDTVLKYKGLGVREVWVVLRNLPAALYLGDLWALRKELGKVMEPVKVEFYVPDLTELKLVALSEILEKLKPLILNRDIL